MTASLDSPPLTAPCKGLERLRVAFVPVWNGNPYHSELAAALKEAGADVGSDHQLKAVCEGHFSGRRRVDIVHLHSLPYLRLSPISSIRYALFFSRLSRLRTAGVTTIWTIHDLDNHDCPWRRVEQVISRYITTRLDGLIVHGLTAKELVIAKWGVEPAKIEIIPHGHYRRAYPNYVSPLEARSRLGIEPSNLVFLFLGLIRPYKGVPEMVSAFRAISHANIRLIIAGKPIDKPMRDRLTRAVAGDGRIRFLPDFVKDEEVQVYMNAADVVVLPYRRILTSGAAILAMSFGKACIAPRAGCVVDALDEAGAELFDPSIGGDLERAMRSTITNPTRLQEMGRHNYSRVSQWDWHGVAAATAKMYRRCIADAKASTSAPRN